MSKLVATAALAFCMLGTPVGAQSAARVLRYTPTDSGTSGNLITVTFDRPVAGMLGQSIDASRVMHVTPAVAGLVEWRDPVTLRFIPNELLAPGTRLTVSVDTAAVATNGARTGKPFEFAVRIPGARPLGQTVEGRMPSPSQVGPFPVFRVLFSGPVNADTIVARSRIVSHDTCGGTIRFRLVSERALVVADRNEFAALTDVWQRDTTADRFMRVVEMVPADSLKPGCNGIWHIPTLDPLRPNDTNRFPVVPFPEFRVQSVGAYRSCPYRSETCDREGLSVNFSAPISTSSAIRLLRTTPALVPDTAMWRITPTQTQNVPYEGRTVPRASYTVTIDSTLEDVYGRRLLGPHTFTVVAPDREPGIKQQSGLVTLVQPADGPITVRIRTLNVDTLVMHVVPLPDSLDAPLLTLTNNQRYGWLPSIRKALRDTLHVVVPVHGVFNEEGNVDVALPAAIAAPGATRLHAIWFEITAGMLAPDSVEYYTTHKRYVSRDAELRRFSLNHLYGTQDLGLIVQVSPLVAHVKVAHDQGAVFATDHSGNPVRNATVALFAGREVLVARGTTDADGLALVSRAPASRMPMYDSTDKVARSLELGKLRYITVTHDGDRLLVPVNGQIAATLSAPLDAGSFGVRGASASRIHGSITPDRNLYRPGETVFAKVFVREGMVGEAVSPVGDSVRVALVRGFSMSDGISVIVYARDDAHDTLGVWKSTLNEFGTASDSIRIPAKAILADYSLVAEVQTHGEWLAVGQTGIRVQEFRAPEFLVSATRDTALRYVGDSLISHVSAWYLFGAPMSGAQVRWSAVSSPAYGAGRTIPGTQGFTIGRSDWWDAGASSEITSLYGTSSIGRDGTLDLHMGTVRGTLTRPSWFNISIAVTDLTNQTVTTTTNAFVQASAVYVAMRDKGTGSYWKRGEPQTVEAFVARPNGEHVTDAPLQVTIVRRRDSLVINANSGNTRRFITDTVLRTTRVSTREPLPITFTPVVEGAYDVRVESADSAGRIALTNIGRRTSPEPWYAMSGANPLALKVTTQLGAGDRFSLGDVAQVAFDSPFPRADAWITLEREGVLEQRRIVVNKGPTTFPVPVSARLAPNVWAGVTLINRQPAPLLAADSVAPLIRAGYVEIKVDSTTHLLHVNVEPRLAIVAPSDSVDVTVKVEEAGQSQQKRSRNEVALWVVDEGVLSMTGFKTPDILHAIDAELGVAQNLRTSLLQLPWTAPTGSVHPGVNLRDLTEGMALAMAVGAIGAPTTLPVRVQPAGIELRSNFRLTAFYIGHAVTDDNGVATIRAKLPDNITTFRLMATAIGAGNRYGSGEATVTAARRVVLRSALPRFVRAGDSLDAATAVNVRSEGSSSLQVSASITNASLGNDSAQTISVSAERGARLYFPIAVPAKTEAEATRVVFTAVDATRRDGDAFATSLPIRPSGTPRSHTVIGMVRDSGRVTIPLPADIDPARSTVTLSLGTSRIVAMRSHYAQMRAYRYPTTDGIAATASSLLALSNAERLTGETVISRDTVAARNELQAAVLSLLPRQASDGGFGYWFDASVSSDADLTAFVGNVLLAARDAGVTVPAATLAGIRRKLENWLSSKNGMVDTVFGTRLERQQRWQEYAGARLRAAEYLRRAGTPALAVEDSLLRVSSDMRWEDRVALVDLLVQRADKSQRARTMLTSLWSAVSVAGRRIDVPDSLHGNGFFPSHIRPAARLLGVTLKVMPDHPLLGALGEYIIYQSAANREWAWNVHDHAAAIEALASLVHNERGATPVQLVARGADGRVLFSRAARSAGSEQMGGDTTRQPLAQLLANSRNSKLTLSLRVEPANEANALPAPARTNSPLYYAVTVQEVPRTPPVTPDIAGFVVERWYENFSTGAPIIEATEGELVRVHLRITAPGNRQFVAFEDMLPAGLEAVDLSMRTSSAVGPFMSATGPQVPGRARDTGAGSAYGSIDHGWWSPWEYKEMYDDRVFYFAKMLWSGVYNTTYIARVTTAGRFIRPPAHAEEIYNAAVEGRSDGGVFVVKRAPQ